MKRIILIAACLFAVTAIGAQSIDEIVKKYTVANKLDKMSAYKTIKLSASMSMMGMDMPMVITMKAPNKIRTSTTFNGSEIVQAFDGEKGWMINPMAGSTDPVEMTAEQIRQTQQSNIFQNYMENYLKEGKLTLAGEEAVNGKPAFKLKVATNGNEIFMFVDKSSYLLVKTSVTVNQQGMTMVVDSYPSDYKETNGILLPMKTTTSAQGMDMVMSISNVEVDLPVEDSVFKLK